MLQKVQTKQPLVPYPRKSRSAIRYLNYSPKTKSYFDKYRKKTAILIATLSKKNIIGIPKDEDLLIRKLQN